MSKTYEITSCFTSGAEFLEHFERSRSSGMFFHRMEEASALSAGAKAGQIVSVVIRFLEPRRDFHVHLRIVEREEIRKGLWLQFLRDERESQDLVCAYAEGKSVAYRRRRGIRVSSTIAVRAYKRSGEVFGGYATNISGRGMQIQISERFEVESRIQLEIAFEGQANPCRVAAEVVAAHPSRRHPGISVEFQFTSSGARDRMSEVVAALPSDITSISSEGED